MQIEAGKFYRDANGEKQGPMIACGRDKFRWTVMHRDRVWWCDNGKAQPGYECVDLIAEWVDEPEQAGPVRTRTVTEIVPGVYGRVRTVEAFTNDEARLRIVSRTGSDLIGDAVMTPAELRAAAAVFVQLADALDGAAK